MNLRNNGMNFKKTSMGVLTLNDAKIKGIGKSTLNLSDNEIIFKSLKSDYTLKRLVNDIDFLIYDKGNFFFDDTIYMGIKGEQFAITCKNNELDLRNFYNNIVIRKEKALPKSNLLIQDSRPTFTENIEENSADETNEPSASEEIRNFYNLMKDGIISEEEFEEKKKELLKSK